MVQAGAYIFKSKCGLDRYLEMYPERRGGLLKEYREVQKMDDYKWTTYTTWTISFKRLSEQSTRFLQLCACLHHDGISEAIFQNAASNVRTYVPRFPETAQESDSISRVKDFLTVFQTLDSRWDSQKFLKMIAEIRSYSLVDYDIANRTYSIHPLVHDWTRTTISNNKATRACMQSILGASITKGYNSEDYMFRRSLQAHIDTILEGGNLARPAFSENFGDVYSEGGRWKVAEELRLQVKETSLRVFEAEHPDTLKSMGDLAVIYLKQGRWKEAEDLQVPVKETCLRVLGAEHPYTLRSMGNLAAIYLNQGRWKEAEEMQVHVKEECFRVLGTEHPHTLKSMGSLAATYWNQGRWKEAEELDVQVKETYLRVLGAEHPDTPRSMGNLASTYLNQGRWKEAEELQFHVKETCPKVLGSEHPYVLKSMGNLAATYLSQGQWKEAEALQIHVMESFLKVLWAKHPETLWSMGSLALTHRYQGRYKEAEELQVQVKETSLGVLGIEHPDTLRIMDNLALTYREQGQYKEAEELEISVKETRLRVLRATHPDTLRRMRLASMCREQGWWKEAEDLDMQVKENCLRVLVAENLDMLRSMGNLAATCGKRSPVTEHLERRIITVTVAKDSAFYYKVDITTARFGRAIRELILSDFQRCKRSPLLPGLFLNIYF